LSAEDFRGRLETTKQEIVDVNGKMEALSQAKERAISMGDAAAAKNANRELQQQLPALQKRLEDLTIDRAAFETKLRIHKMNEPKAANIRKHLAEDLWPNAKSLHEQFRAFQAGLRPVLEKGTQMNNEFLALANEHKQLIGEKIYTPRLPIPQEFYAAAAVKLEPLPKSLDVRLPAERERDRVAEQIKLQRPTISRILKRVNIEYPQCPTCGAELLGVRYEVARDESNGYAEMKCAKHPDMWLSVSFPARPVLSAAGHPIPNAPVPLADITGPAASTIQGHDLAQPGLTIEDEKQGGKKTK
jgi:hypothetical protein